MAFMVNPVKPKVGFISGAVLSAIESFSPYVGGYDGGRGAGRYRGPASLYAANNSAQSETEISYRGNKRFVCGCFGSADGLAADTRTSCVIFAFTRAQMKIAGFLLLLSGLFLVVSALALLRDPSPQALFVLLGIAVEVLGLAMVFRAHLTHKERRR